MPNRLADERSPYLQQHADNPVDWYPWGPEALALARAEDRPILLSIGYSACHWCHVMEHESFDDSETAALLNAHFVSIKVDREERPDLDAVYMKAIQSLTGRGGWPLTAFLTPGGEPFYGGTYYPPEPRRGMPSFRQVLSAVHEAWTERREQVLEGASQLRQAVAMAMAPPEAPDGGVRGAGAASGDSGADEAGPPPAADGTLLTGALRHLRERFDPAHGGFGGAPKFPQPVTLEFLLGRHAATGDATTLELVVHTLRKMAAGGVRDHLGGGFHRYSVDARWLVPHFEKMLYDNALLARVYLDAWRASGVEDFARVARETLGWILDDMQAPEGGFYSARDADSQGREGLFYLWTPAEVEAVGAAAGIDDATVARFRRVYDVSDDGNFEGRSILNLPHGFEAAARREELAPEALRGELIPLLEALLEARATREPPLRDDKILCAWTAFTIRALAESGRLLGEEDHLHAARRAADFVLRQMRVDGRLYRVWSHGAARIDGFLEDHAALGNALLTLHAATLEPRWLPGVRWCVDQILARFHDPDSDLLHDTPVDGEALVVRPRDVADSATPSGTSLAVELLLRAGHLFDEAEWTAIARRALAREASRMARHPGGFGRLLRQVERIAADPVEVAIFGAVDDPATRGLLDAAWALRHPHLAVAGGDPAAFDTGLRRLPLFRDRGTVAGRPAAWICRDFACRAPVTDADEIRLEGDR